MAQDDEDFEADLLEVAGIGRQGGGGVKKRVRKMASESEDELSADEAEAGGRAVGQKKKRRVVSAKDAAQAMSDSEDYGDGYGSDLMGDEADRARLNQLSELDRELELHDRGENRQMIKMKRDLAKQQQQQQQVQQAAADKAGAMRSSTRMKTANNAKKDALAELAAARSAKERRTKQTKARAGKRRDDDAWSEEGSLSESDEEARGSDDASIPSRSLMARSDREDEQGVGRDAARLSDDEDRLSDGRGARYDTAHVHEDEEDGEEIEMEEGLKILITRGHIEKWVDEPYFDDTVPGCLVRVSHAGGYLLGVITGIEHREPGMVRERGQPPLQCPYTLDNGKSTDVWLTIEIGRSVRSFPIKQMSNQTITQKEFAAWRHFCKTDGVTATTQKECREVQRRLAASKTYVYTPADIQRMVVKRRQEKGGFNVAIEKARLQRERDYAQQTGDFATVAEKEAALAQLETRMMGAGKQVKNSMANINKRNAAVNFNNALNNVSARPGAASGTIVNQGDDVFARRSTRPMTYWATGKKDKKDDSVAGLTVKTEAGSVDAAAAAEEPETPAAAPATATYNAQGGWDLNIDLSRLKVPTTEQVLARKLLGPRWKLRPNPAVGDVSGKIILTMADYKRRQGLG
ncbi:hypothetical protein WJX73_004538 [Symbiochloris irregularis]|uniref:Plus3 domain-containing protein n=1 Tax=Symbiochloris irregularis TaxID=706552 RepID=A0AAW1PED2_9CHLO